MPKTEHLKPYQFKSGYDPRRHIKQAGEISFKTAFEKAVKYIAKQSKHKIKVDETVNKIIARMIYEAQNGNYSFCKDIIDRLYGQAKQKIEISEKPLLVLPVPEKDKDKEKNK
jgi:hypothetical protein